MLLILACLLATTAAAPATYDQRQDGEFNVRADVQNVLLLVAIPEKMSVPLDILDGLINLKHNGRDAAQDRSDVNGEGKGAMNLFVEPSTPYRVEIGTKGSERSVDGEVDGRAVEVVIAAKRRSDAEPQPERDEYKLLGATEQCGPESERDPVTLTCRPLRKLEPEETPEVVPVSS